MLFLLYSNAFSTSSGEQSSTKASPLGRPSEMRIGVSANVFREFNQKHICPPRWLIAKWTLFSPSGVLHSSRNIRMSFAVASKGSPRSLMMNGLRSEFMLTPKMEIIDLSVNTKDGWIWELFFNKRKQSKQQIGFSIFLTNLAILSVLIEFTRKLTMGAVGWRCFICY